MGAFFSAKNFNLRHGSTIKFFVGGITSDRALCVVWQYGPIHLMLGERRRRYCIHYCWERRRNACSWRVVAVEKSGAETCRCCGVYRRMPFKQVYVWTPPPGSSGKSLVFGLSDDKDWWVVESMATSMLIRNGIVQVQGTELSQ